MIGDQVTSLTKSLWARLRNLEQKSLSMVGGRGENRLGGGDPTPPHPHDHPCGAAGRGQHSSPQDFSHPGFPRRSGDPSRGGNMGGPDQTAHRSQEPSTLQMFYGVPVTPYQAAFHCDSLLEKGRPPPGETECQPQKQGDGQKAACCHHPVPLKEAMHFPAEKKEPATRHPAPQCLVPVPGPSAPPCTYTSDRPESSRAREQSSLTDASRGALGQEGEGCKGTAHGTPDALQGSPQPDPQVGLGSGYPSGPQYKAHGTTREMEESPG